MTPSRSNATLLAALLLALAGMLLAMPAAAQRKQHQGGKVIRVDDPCQRKTDKAPGAVRIDGCGRVYCGRADVKDIFVVWPNIADQLNCTWRLEDNRCRCRPRDSARK
jgi:hypothetical protein